LLALQVTFSLYFNNKFLLFIYKMIYLINDIIEKYLMDKKISSISENNDYAW
jgi:hypothetical protein